MGRTKSRGNGTGTAYRRGNTWRAAVVVDWKVLPGNDYLTPVRRTKGGFRTKKEALAYLPTLLQDAHKAALRAPTLAECWAAYKNGRYQDLSPSKQTGYRIAWGKLSALHSYPADHVTVSDLQSAVAAVAFTYYTARDCRTVLTRVIEIAAAEGWCSKDLPSFIRLPPLEEKARDAFSDLEQAALWRLYESGDLRVAVPLLMIATGMMPGELLALRVKNIDLQAHKITGIGLKTKVRRESPVYLPTDIHPVLEDLIASARPDGYLLPRDKKRFYLDYYAALDAAGCRRLEPYCCRHTTATRLAVTENLAPQTIRRVMRWSTVRMLDRYAHPTDEDAVAASNSALLTPH